jgi:pimeloyl-ACP methyl ester carboxylesterase
VPQSDVDVYVDRLRERARASATARLYRSALTTVATNMPGGDPAPRSTSPTLLMTGEKDPVVVPRLAEGLERGGDDMRFESIPGAGHFICDTHADVIAARVRSHLG